MSNLFKLILFVVLLLAHMYCYDPSVIKFVDNIKGVSNLKFNDSFLFNSVIWIIGFWGLILFMNSKNMIVKLVSWALFVCAASIQFGYMNILQESFSVANAGKLEHMIEHLHSIDPMELMKFIGITAAFLVMGFILRPVAPQITATFIIVLLASVTLVTIAYRGENIVLPTFYLVPVLMLYDQFKDLIPPQDIPHGKQVISKSISKAR
jgi:NADH:ubiquinone oxidoreductase subunit K